MSGFIGDTWGMIKEHPVISAGVVVGVGLGVLLLKNKAAPAAQQSGGGYYNGQSSSVTNAEIAAAQQTAQINAQASAQSEQYGVQLQSQQYTDATQITLAQITAQTAALTNKYSYTLGADNLQVQAYNDSLQAQVANNTISSQAAVQESQIASNVSIADINSTTAITTNQANDTANMFADQIIGQTQQQISTNETNAVITESNNAAAVAESSSGFGALSSIGSVVGMVAMMA